MIEGVWLWGRKVPLAQPVGGVARSVKMLTRKQVAALKKARYLNILDNFMQKRTFYYKISEATNILMMFYEA
jgi:hypothetical protein